MRALVIEDLERPPGLRAVDDPPAGAGDALVRVLAAGLNPVDLAIGAGRFYLPIPDPPFVAGCEAVGVVEASERIAPGTLVWTLGHTGAFAERLRRPDALLVPVPGGLAPEAAVAMGVAGLAGWMPVRDRGGLRPGETVLVLGAGGAVGRVALQAARAGGAGRVVAALRGAAGAARAEELGADEVVVLGGADDRRALAAACAPGADLVIDTLWGEPLTAALGALSLRARIVQVGGSAGAQATIPAGTLRGGRLDVLGYSVFREEHADLARAYGELAAAAARGEVTIPTERVPLADGAEAWARQGAGTGGVKLVLVP